MRFNGQIVRLVRDRGFGFIKDIHNGEEYFFHRSAMTGGGEAFDGLRENQAVTFALGTSPKGPRAEDVEVERR